MLLRGANVTIANAFAVNDTATYYTNRFNLDFDQTFGIWLITTSVSGTPKLQIQLEESYTEEATVNAADSNWVIGDGVPDIYSVLNDEIVHIKNVTPVPMKYGRLKITGLSGNPSDSIITAIIFRQGLGGV